MKTCSVWVGRETRWLPLCVAAGLLSIFSLRQAHADGMEYAQTGAAPSIAATPEAVSSPPLGADARFDQLQIKGWNIPLPGAADTIDEDPLGLRSALADVGVGYFGFTNSYFTDNLIHHQLPVSRQTQLYSGQLDTVFSSNFAYVTYDLSRYGVPDGQIVIGGNFVRTNFYSLGPDDTSISTASYYQTLLNGKVEIKLGYIADSLEFLGTYVGGSLAGGVFGPNGTIPVEQGESTTVYPTPGVNIKVNFPDSIYSKLGVSRALSPDGVVIENEEDVAGVRFAIPNSGVFIIDETGYRVPAAVGQMQTWIRAAASYTSSNYRNYSFSNTNLRSDHNYGLYLFGDRQLVQTASAGGRPSQGIYAGFTVEYAPPALNRFSQYYEGRLYGFGLIPTRPRDLLSFVVTSSTFSSYLVNSAIAAKELAHSSTQSITLTYSAHVLPGVNLNAGVSYTNNPTSVTYNTHTGSDLNILLGTVTFF